MNALAVLFLGGWLAGSTNAPVVTVAAPDRAYATRAGTLAAAGHDFSAIFQELCALALGRAQGQPAGALADETRALFGGLWHWARNGGRPRLQDQPDKALHFIAGGAFQAYLDAGRAAAVAKEENDRRDPGNAYDLDDLAATMLGARWVELATTPDAAANRRWVTQWAEGQMTLSRSLPKLDFGRLARGQTASPAELEKVRAAVAAAFAPITPAEPTR